MKQRLIDANKLHPTYHQGTYIGGGMYDGEGYTVDYEEIENAPTIEAIPIKWLANFCYKCEKETQQLSEIRLAVETWRKENEK